jgi:hypothetical protein
MLKPLTVFRIRIADPHWIRIRIANGDPDPKGENQTQKEEKLKYEDQKKL